MVSLVHVRGMGTKAIALISHRHGLATAAATGMCFAPLSHAVLGEGPGVRAARDPPRQLLARRIEKPLTPNPSPKNAWERGAMVSLAHVRGMGTKAIALISHRLGLCDSASYRDVLRSPLPRFVGRGAGGEGCS